MAEYFRLDEKKIYRRCNETEADHVLIPMNEYNGLQKALRMVKEYGKQQIDQSDYDEHGYQIRRASIVKYPGTSEKVYLVEKRTSYLVKYPDTDILELVIQDLRQFYHMPNWDEFNISKEDFIVEYYRYLSGETTTLDQKTVEMIEKFGRTIVLDIRDLKWNFERGFYEISYYATFII